jgi:hypothetical protein
MSGMGVGRETGGPTHSVGRGHTDCSLVPARQGGVRSLEAPHGHSGSMHVWLFSKLPRPSRPPFHAPYPNPSPPVSFIHSPQNRWAWKCQ